METDGDPPFLPQEVITNILKRLPVKSLVQFQCVCKQWKHLIKTPSFIADHFHHSNDENPLVLLQWDGRCDPLHLHLLDYELEVTEIQPSPLIDSLQKIRIIGSSYGLLCVNVGISANIPNFLLWNPAIRQVAQVPIGGVDKFSFVGFGFSPIVNDCKIVIADENQIDYVYNRVEVYSLSTGSWKEIKVEYLVGVSVFENSVTANGAIFWSGGKYKEDDQKEDDEYDDVIVSFDIATEVFTLIPMPAAFNSDSRGWLTVYQNKLAMFSNTVIGNDESHVIHLWVMEEGTGASGERWSWSKKYSISTCSSYLSPFSIWGNKIVCDVVYPFQTKGEANNEMIIVLSLFDLTTHELENVNICRCGSYLNVLLNYAESLVPVGNVQVEEP